jgi:hypothetical protein
MNLTKEDRFVLYCILLEEAKTNIKMFAEHGYFYKDTVTGLCNLIYKTFGIDVDSGSFLNCINTHMSNVFPELWDQRPNVDEIYWFPVSVKGWKQRIKLLKKCIELTA